MRIPLQFAPFHNLVNNLTTDTTRSRYSDSSVVDMNVWDEKIEALVKGTNIYRVEIKYNETAVFYAGCSCPYDKTGYCKHIVHVLVHADVIVCTKNDQKEERIELFDPELLTRTDQSFILKRPAVIGLSDALIKVLSEERGRIRTKWAPLVSINQAQLSPNNMDATVNLISYSREVHRISIQQQQNQILLRCDCGNRTDKLCLHLNGILSEIQSNKDLQLAFNTEARQQLLSEKASANGWNSDHMDLDSLFKISFSHGRLYVDLKINLLSLTSSNRETLKKSLLTQFKLPQSDLNTSKEFILIKQKAYEDRLDFTLMTAPLAKSGDIKTPLTPVNIFQRLRASQKREELLFYTALTTFGSYQETIESYRDIFKNPFELPFYFYQEEFAGEKVKTKQLTSILAFASNPMLEIQVKESGDFYVLTCQIQLDNKKYNTDQIQLNNALIRIKNKMYTLNNEAEVKVLDFFAQHKNQVYLVKNQFISFKTEFLDQLENNVSISYSFLKPAPARLIKEQDLQTLSKPVIFLSDLENYVLITPTIAYGDIEVPVLSKRTAYTNAPDGTLYAITRDEVTERQLIRTIQAQHPSFDSIPTTEFFFLHKKEFLDAGWFIQAFETWRQEGYTIHGFNKLNENRYNAHGIRVKTSVQSGIDWFDIHTDISFGDQKVSLRQLQKSVANKSRFIELSDGTQGLLPQEWLEKFAHYFRNGDIKEDRIRTHKSNFQLIDDLFEDEVLTQEVQEELTLYKEKLANFQSICSVKIPKKLKANLRDYQKEGLNWLNFLDEFGFGGCLADDMGLGKTVQVIAYFLAQHEKGNTSPNLVIVPTSLLFNWQKEIDKFAPHLKYHLLYGLKRKTDKLKVEKYDIILTTYGTLLSDVEWLKKQTFNIIVLDESQAIKNPNAKRYKAARLLQARQRLLLTGTPVENNTFDLYAQLSFAIPGLLGSAKRFATDYSTPIDKFQDSKRAQELQHKIHPFVLRRTKKQVAHELPEKTEMIVYCAMGEEQKRVYDSYKLEFQKYLAGIDESELHSSSLHILQGLTKMRQICNSPALLGDDEFYGNESAKLEELMEQIAALKDAHKILVFSQFVGMLDMIKSRLEKEGIGYAYLTGQTRNRQEQVENFQQEDNIRVFLISLKAGGTGLNLTQAEYVFLIDPWWNPAVENQAIDRAYRIGQQNKVIAVRFITPESIEEKILELQLRKRQLAEELIHTDGSMLKQLSKDDLMGLL